MNTEEFIIHRRPGWGASLTLTIECDPLSPYWVKLGIAVKTAIANRASLDGARLDGARLDGARLDGASLVGASLVGASLDGARLDGARLVGARLDGARLVGARLDGARLYDSKIKRLVACASRSDGYVFYAFETEAHGVMIKAGCRWFSPEQFRAHVLTYDEYERTRGKDKETSRILDFIEGRMVDLEITAPAKPKRQRKAA